MTRLAGRVAIITGGPRGIGRAVARAFAREGARVVVNYLFVTGQTINVDGGWMMH